MIIIYLSNMCNITHLKQLIVGIYFWKITIIYSKVLYLIINVQVQIQNFYFKLSNMCKFAHDRKTHIVKVGLTNRKKFSHGLRFKTWELFFLC